MSSDSESDEEYVPGEPEKVSEEESADDETEKQYELEQEAKDQKRKSQSTVKGKKRQKTNASVKETTPEKEIKEDTEAEKKREDDLWAMFLDGTDQKPKPAAPKEVAKAAPMPAAVAAASSADKSLTDDKADAAKDKEKRIFEFAGETIVVENNVIKEKIKTPVGTPTAPVASGAKRASGGLAGVLGAIGKSNRLSTLDKSKLDWETYKQAEGIDDEVKAINKGKQGYLERQDFLQRADLRQYEIERDLRMSRRSNR